MQRNEVAIKSMDGQSVGRWRCVVAQQHVTNHGYSPNSTWLVTSRHDTTRSTCRAHAFWLCRACRTARLDTLVSTRSTRRTCRVVSWLDVTSQVEFGHVLCRKSSFALTYAVPKKMRKLWRVIAASCVDEFWQFVVRWWKIVSEIIRVFQCCWIFVPSDCSNFPASARDWIFLTGPSSSSHIAMIWLREFSSTFFNFRCDICEVQPRNFGLCHPNLICSVIIGFYVAATLRSAWLKTEPNLCNQNFSSIRPWNLEL